MEKEKTSVLVVDDIANTREDIKRLLYFEEDIIVVGEAGDGEEALRQVQELKPDVVLMDINMPGMDGIMATEAIFNSVPDTAIIIISIQGEPEYLKKAMAAGARDYLVKPLSSNELSETIRRVSYSCKTRASRLTAVSSTETKAEPAEPELPANRIIVIFSSKGGVGKTTLSCNLAVCLAQERRKKVALVDLNLQGGDVSVMLNLSPKGTIADLVKEEDGIEYSLINSFMAPHMSGLKILPAPLRPEEADVITSAHIVEILTMLKNHYDFIVVDTTPFFNDMTLSAMEIADDILLTFTRDLAAIKHVATDLEILETLALSDKVKLVLNRATLDYGIKINELEKRLNQAPAVILPYDEKTVLSSVNKGHPFVLTHHNTRIAQSIRSFSREFSIADKDGPAEAPVKKSFVAKLFSL